MAVTAYYFIPIHFIISHKNQQVQKNIPEVGNKFTQIGNNKYVIIFCSTIKFKEPARMEEIFILNT